MGNVVNKDSQSTQNTQLESWHYSLQPQPGEGTDLFLESQQLRQVCGQLNLLAAVPFPPLTLAGVKRG